MAGVDRQYVHMPIYVVIARLNSVMGRYHCREVQA
jgi:hypothetical protein